MRECIAFGHNFWWPQMVYFLWRGRENGANGGARTLVSANNYHVHRRHFGGLGAICVCRRGPCCPPPLHEILPCRNKCGLSNSRHDAVFNNENLSQFKPSILVGIKCNLRHHWSMLRDWHLESLGGNIILLQIPKSML